MSSFNLQVTIDPKAGFCFGVIGAIDKAEAYLKTNEELYCLGEIVHNDEEVQRLKNKGLIVIDNDELKKLKGKTILFRAHGEPPISYDTAVKNGNTIIDASCPIIKKLQEKVSNSYAKGENIVIYGKHDHPEIIGLNGYIKNQAIIVQSIEDVDLGSMPKQITLYSQTTKSLDGFYKLIDYLRENGIEVKVKDTICRQVSHRQPELNSFCSEFDKIVFVAGRKSSNGKVLYSVCKKANERAYFISATTEIDKSWFEPNERVGISGATSTPRWLMEEVKDFLMKL